MKTNAKSVDVLDEAAAMEAKLAWVLFKAEQEAVLRSGDSDWVPGDPLYVKHKGNTVRNMIDLFDLPDEIDASRSDAYAERFGPDADAERVRHEERAHKKILDALRGTEEKKEKSYSSFDELTELALNHYTMPPNAFERFSRVYPTTGQRSGRSNFTEMLRTRLEAGRFDLSPWTPRPGTPPRPRTPPPPMTAHPDFEQYADFVRSRPPEERAVRIVELPDTDLWMDPETFGPEIPFPTIRTILTKKRAMGMMPFVGDPMREDWRYSWYYWEVE